MNPFLKPTVAIPQPDVQWREPSSGDVDVRAPKSVSPKTLVPKPRAGRRRQRLRSRSGNALRVLTLAASLFLPALVQAVDINTATVQQLQEIKGIGPKTASLIIEERERGGAFESMTDVSERVKGIGPKKAASLETAGLKVGGAANTAGKKGDATTRTARRGR